MACMACMGGQQMSDKPGSELAQTGASSHHVCMHSVSPTPFGQIQ